MRGAVVAHGGHSRVGEVAWSSTSNMNMRDLSRDDDFLSFMLVEQLGTDSFPLVVHKMDPSRRLPRHDPKEILNIVQRWIVTIKSASSAAKRVRGAVDALLRLEAVAHYLRGKTQMQINAFATHASRYFELYVPTGTIEIAHTSRYSKWTGKAELCILATTTLKIGTVITELKGSMAVLTEDENEELKRTDRRNTDGGIRRDFSVIHSGHRKKNHLFLGPARFVNHDCDNNCELFREGKYITFRVIKPIERGQEITAHYGDAYFGKDNRHCLCETCEKRGKGGYRQSDYTDSDASSDSASTIPPRETLGQVQKVEMLGEVNERRTRRGVYLKLPDSESDSEEEVQTEVTEAVIQIDDPEDANTASRSSSLSKLSTPPLSSIPTSPGALINPLPTPDSLSSRSQSESAQGDRPSDQAPSSTAATSATFTPVKAQAVKSLSLSQHNLIAKQSSTLSSSPRANIQLKSPPLSEDAHSIPDEAQSSQAATTLPAAPAQRRFSARLNTRTPERNKELTPRAKSRHRTAESTDDKKIATPQTRASTVQSQDRKASTPVADEPRSLRSKSKPALPPKAKPRVSGTPADKGKAADEKAKTALASPKRRGKKKAPPPRLCKVCSRELPPLNPDSADEDSEEDKGECSRCLRHRRIFGASWPSRAPQIEIRSPSPICIRPPDSASKSIRSSRDADRENDQRPAKRRKTDSALELREHLRNGMARSSSPLHPGKKYGRSRQSTDSNIRDAVKKLEKRQKRSGNAANASDDDASDEDDETPRNSPHKRTRIEEPLEGIPLRQLRRTTRRVTLADVKSKMTLNSKALTYTPHTLAMRRWMKFDSDEEMQGGDASNDSSEIESALGDLDTRMDSLSELDPGDFAESEQERRGVGLLVFPQRRRSLRLAQGQGQSIPTAFPEPLENNQSSKTARLRDRHSYRSARTAYRGLMTRREALGNAQKNNVVDLTRDSDLPRAVTVDPSLLKKQPKNSVTLLEETFFDPNADRDLRAASPNPMPFFDYDIRLKRRRTFLVPKTEPVSWSFHENYKSAPQAVVLETCPNLDTNPCIDTIEMNHSNNTTTFGLRLEDSDDTDHNGLSFGLSLTKFLSIKQSTIKSSRDGSVTLQCSLNRTVPFDVTTTAPLYTMRAPHDFFDKTFEAPRLNKAGWDSDANSDSLSL